jgi:GntR family transcriptional regulator/MocR family aminotransferase
MDLLLDLDAASGTTLRKRAEHALREAVRSGRLAPGARLPATRTLAAQLGVSRGVVVEAYAQLAAEGYLVTRRGGGTTVAAGAAGGLGAPGACGAASGAAGGGATAHAADAHGGLAVDRATVTPFRAIDDAPPLRHDLRPALPALSGFPRRAWLAALGRALRALPDERLGYPHPAGAPELRTTLADYLGRVRGVRTVPERIVVTNGFRQGVDLLWEALAERGARRVALERPGWRGWYETAAAAGLETVPIPVDRDGAAVELLDELGVDAVGLSPAHQFPTGAVLSPERRGALVAWAQRTGGVVVEDDYDAEFRYDRKPIGSLQGLAPDLVVYGGTASKTLAPAVRLGWLVLPPGLAEPVARVQRRVGGAPAPLDQLALADLVGSGALDRHLRRERRRYLRQRAALLEALARELPAVEVHGAAAGLHAVLVLPAGLDAHAVAAASRERGVALEVLDDPDGPPALVVGYSNVGEHAAGAAVAALADAVAATTAARPPHRRPA